jgi:hypothetical protein
MPKIENDTGEIRTFLIPVTWQEQGQFIVRARTLQEAIDAVENDDNRFSTGRANGEYIDNSFEVNKDCLAVVNEKEVAQFYSDDQFTDLTVENTDESVS